MSYGNRYKFYQSKAWQDTRKTIWLKQNLLCNRCHRPVYVDGISDYIPKDKRLIGIVHHIEYLNESNLSNQNITLGINNLEGLCIDCHNKEHDSQQGVLRKNYMFDEEGNLVQREGGTFHH